MATKNPMDSQSMPPDTALLEWAEYWYPISWKGLLIAGAVTAFAACATIACLLLQWRTTSIREQYSEFRTSSLESPTAEAKKETARLSITAETLKAQNLALQQKLAPRWLSPQQQQELQDKLSRFPGITVQMWIFPAGTADIAPLANLLASIMKKASWFPERSTSLSGEPFPSVNVAPRVGTTADEPAKVLVEYLKSAGIEATIVAPFSTDEPLIPAVVGDPKPTTPFMLRMAVGTKP